MDKEDTQENVKKEGSSADADPGDILQPARFRRSFRISDEMDRILSGNRYYILFHLNFLLLYILDYVKGRS